MIQTVNKFSWKVAGEAGHGILNAGLQMFARSCLRAGLFVFAYAEYPSLIRGGHNSLDIKVSDREVFAHTTNYNFLIALDKNSIDKHIDNLATDAGVVYDSDVVKIDSTYIKRKDIFVYPIPMFQLAERAGGKIMRNTVAMGATFALTEFDLEILNGVIRDTFGKKGDAVVNANILAAKMGYDYVKSNFNVQEYPFKLKAIDKKEKRLFMSGNEAATAGAIKAGCKFYSAYPMTPASSILSNMASQERNYNIVVKHTEDEISAINMAIGAAYAGVRAATGTSGGGFALMSEGFGMAAQTEVPIVVIEAQRPGPGTGMATHSSQGDLNFMINASTDEFPRIVLAPGSVDDCFYMMIDAFNLAEKYQMPVIFLTDKYLGESFRSVPYFDTNRKIERGKLMTDKEAEEQKDYRRYKITEDGISPRAVPGQKNCMHTASSYEHDETGFEREEEENRVAMHKKRFRKMETAAKEIEGFKFYDKKSDTTIISWGSTKGSIKEALIMLESEELPVNFCQITCLSPLPTRKIEDVLKTSKKVILIENNMTAQLGGVIRQKTGMEIIHKILKFDGRPFSPENIHVTVKKMMEDDSISKIEVCKSKIIEIERHAKKKRS
ncbi:MAG: 2-oxoacid:acceptor oxidoreductase subunit alpha [Candidatus Aenigmarchaeota archaeon]|nr:2-oxoacid:acceptor oxidoreductase subunit alpha [Candidatus Aenigmarchaeota archaeon]